MSRHRPSISTLIYINVSVSMAPTFPEKCTEGYELPNPDELRKLAAWYREFAERAGEPAIWEARLRTAKELEAEAARVEATLPRERGDMAQK